MLEYEQKPYKGWDTTGGAARLYVNGKQVGEGAIGNVVPGRFSATETLDIGMDLGSTVSAEYHKQKPFAFTGRIEDVAIDFEPEGIRRLAEIAWSVNEKTENIGARRLHTVMERLLEEISFDAGRHGKESIRIDAAFVDAKLKELAQSEDLARYVL